MKRSPLKRKTPLKAKASLKRGGAIKPKRKPPKPKAEAAHLARVAAMPCCVTGQRPVVLHHIMHMAGKATRRDDRYVVPLVVGLHNAGNQSVHMLGSERKFLEVHGVDLVEIAEREWLSSSGR